jgi:hypothetical protein
VNRAPAQVRVRVLSTDRRVVVRPLVTNATSTAESVNESSSGSSGQQTKSQSRSSGNHIRSNKEATHRESSRSGVPHKFISAALALGTNRASTLSIQETKGGVQFSLTTKARSGKDPQLVRIGLDEYAVNNAQHMTKRQQDQLTAQLRHQHKKVTFRN